MPCDESPHSTSRHVADKADFMRIRNGYALDQARRPCRRDRAPRPPALADAAHDLLIDLTAPAPSRRHPAPAHPCCAGRRRIPSRSASLSSVSLIAGPPPCTMTGISPRLLQLAANPRRKHPAAPQAYCRRISSQNVVYSSVHCPYDRFTQCILRCHALKSDKRH